MVASIEVRLRSIAERFAFQPAALRIAAMVVL
jgi:hypothetical protein